MNLIVFRKKFFLFSVFLILLVFLSFASGFYVRGLNIEAVPVTAQRLVPVYKVDRPDNRIAITLDGTWGADFTEEILQIFADHDIKISFFFAGYWLEKYPELVKKIAAEGHGVENHSYTHPHCNLLSRKSLIEELEKTSDLIEELTGDRPTYFRPPFGEYNDNVVRISRELGYQVVQWSIDSLDWKEPGEDFIVKRILDNISAGDIVLMHNNAPDTPGALRRIIPELQKRGYQIVPLSELIYEKDYRIQTHNGLQVRINKSGDQR